MEAMHVDPTMNIKNTLATKPLSHKDKDDDLRKHQCNYCQVIGMLNYLSSTTQPDISMTTHQCARFCEDPKAQHELGVRHIGK